MSVLYGELSGAGKTTATRRGRPNSGISAHIRGYERGVYTSINAVCTGEKRTRPNPGDKKKLRMTVNITGGSNNPLQSTVIHTEEWEE